MKTRAELTVQKHNVKELLEAFGWEDLGPQKNKIMLSFKKEDKRINYYFTTGSITVQEGFGRDRTFLDSLKYADSNQIEKFISKIL